MAMRATDFYRGWKRAKGEEVQEDAHEYHDLDDGDARCMLLAENTLQLKSDYQKNTARTGLERQMTFV
jgi:hypothetical protein